MTQVPIGSDRLTLRLPAPGDAASIAHLLNDEDVVRHLSHVPFPYSIEDAHSFIDSSLGRGLLKVGHAFLIEERSTHAVVGAIGVRAKDLPDGLAVGEIGYWVGKAHWGQGFATEAVAALLPHCFDVWGMDRVTANVNAENVASRRVLEKCSFSAVGLVDLWMPARGHATPSVVMVLGADQRACDNALPIVIVVAVALLDGDDRVLIAQRPEGKAMAGLREFPGGKIAPGESPEAALIRELNEELGIDTEQSCLAPFCFASHRYDSFHLLMPLYICRVWAGQPRGREGQSLRWVAVNDLRDIAMPAADVPLVAMLRDFL